MMTTFKEDTTETELVEYRQHLLASRSTLSRDACVDHYKDRASTYDAYVAREKYNGPTIVTEAVVKHVSDDSSIDILDIAAGTGILGQKLREAGFTNIDALDDSGEMLNVARAKNVYRHFFKEPITDQKSSIADAAYDCVAISGGMAGGHIPCEALREMIRIVKPGGLVVNVLRASYLTDISEYKDRLEPFMERLERENKWRLLERTERPDYLKDYPGILYVHRVI